MNPFRPQGQPWRRQACAAEQSPLERVVSVAHQPAHIPAPQGADPGPRLRLEKSLARQAFLSLEGSRPNWSRAAPHPSTLVSAGGQSEPGLEEWRPPVPTCSGTQRSQAAGKPHTGLEEVHGHPVISFPGAGTNPLTLLSSPGLYRFPIVPACVPVCMCVHMGACVCPPFPVIVRGVVLSLLNSRVCACMYTRMYVCACVCHSPIARGVVLY